MSIVFEDCHKVYDRTLAVDGLSFAVGPGESLVPVGPDAAGKTTTTPALVGILDPTGGPMAIPERVERSPVAAVVPGLGGTGGARWVYLAFLLPVNLMSYAIENLLFLWYPSRVVVG